MIDVCLNSTLDANLLWNTGQHSMTSVMLFVVITMVLLATAYWWRFRSPACPEILTWLLDNPYMNAVAGAKIIIERLKLDNGMNALGVASGPGRLSLPIAKYTEALVKSRHWIFNLKSW